jgi:hypothetical protein
VTVDALIVAGSDARIIAAMLTACAADSGAAAREAERREADKERQRKCRARKDAKRADAARVTEPELPLSPCHVTGVTERDTGDTPPPPSSPPHPPNNYPHPVDDDGEGARVVSLISPAAHELATEIAAIAGIDPDPLACPPGWCGAAMRVQAWLTSGAAGIAPAPA